MVTQAASEDPLCYRLVTSYRVVGKFRLGVWILQELLEPSGQFGR